MQGFIGWNPLQGARWTAGLLPLKVQQVLQVQRGPLGRCLGPRALKATGYRIFGMAFTAFVFPTQTLFLNAGGTWLRTDTGTGLVRAMHFAEGVTTGHQRHGFLIAHGHSSKSDSNISSRPDWIRLAHRPFWIDINQTHVGGAEGPLQLTALILAITRKHF